MTSKVQPATAKRLPPNAGKGRKAGVPNKTTTAAREAFQMAFDKIGGPEAMAKWATDNQTEFYKLFARLIPVDVQGKVDGSLRVEIIRFADS